MNKPPKIAFLIPTYNRCDILHESLSHLLSYSGGEIEVVICDNASPDATEGMVNSIADSRIKYFRNNKNVGAVKNIIKTFRVATAEWVFTLSDEDHVGANIVENLLRVVSSQDNAGAAVMLGNIRNACGPYEYYAYHNGSDYVPYKWSNRIYCAGDDAIEAVGFHHKYMSGVMIKKRFLDFDLLNDFSARELGVAPFTPAYTAACAQGDAVTFDMDFVVKTEQSQAKSYVETVGKRHYRHPGNRYKTFEYYVDLTESLMKNFEKKIDVMARVYGYYLDEGTYGWWHLLNSAERAKRYGVDPSVEFDLRNEVERFDAKARIKFRQIFTVEDSYRRLEKLIDARFAYFIRKRSLSLG